MIISFLMLRGVIGKLVNRHENQIDVKWQLCRAFVCFVFYSKDQDQVDERWASIVEFMNDCVRWPAFVLFNNVPVKKT